MSVYDPRALPFWEIERGDGPCTRLMLRRAYLEKRFREEPFVGMYERLSNPVMPQGCSWTSKYAEKGLGDDSRSMKF